MVDEPHYIHFGYNNQAEGWRIPVNPESIEIKEEGQSKSYNIVGKGGGTKETRAGEVNVIKSPKLKEVSFSSVFPSQAYPFVLEPQTLAEPMKYVKDIRRWMESMHPIRFIFTGYYAASVLARGENKEEAFDLNFPASIESFTWKEVAGSPGDIEYTIRLKEYVFYSARRVQTVVQPNGEVAEIVLPPDRSDERIRPETYTLVKDDTLMHVARKTMDDPDRWREIKELNGLTDAQLMRLPIGMVLKIPQT